MKYGVEIVSQSGAQIEDPFTVLEDAVYCVYLSGHKKINVSG